MAALDRLCVLWSIARRSGKSRNGDFVKDAIERPIWAERAARFGPKPHDLFDGWLR